VFGAAKSDPPVVVSCKTDACAVHFSGPTRRSRAILSAKPRPLVVINGLGALTRGTMIHEMVHVEIARRLGQAPARALPTWFNEGVATFVGDNAPCPPGTKRAVDDLRRLDASFAWEGVTNMTGRIRGAYCQARDEIAAWGARRGKPALVEMIDAIAAGQPFDDVHGPLLTAIPKESYDRSLDGRFELDENVGTNAIDESGRSHLGSLMDGAIWTTGHHGSAVKVLGGAHVRADGFADLGVPETPRPQSRSRIKATWASSCSSGWQHENIIRSSSSFSARATWCDISSANGSVEIMKEGREMTPPPAHTR
jgi:hypothetical protein